MEIQKMKSEKLWRIADRWLLYWDTLGNEMLSLFEVLACCFFLFLSQSHLTCLWYVYILFIFVQKSHYYINIYRLIIWNSLIHYIVHPVLASYFVFWHAVFISTSIFSYQVLRFVPTKLRIDGATNLIRWWLDPAPFDNELRATH